MKKQIKISPYAELALGITAVCSIFIGTAIGFPFIVEAEGILKDYKSSEEFAEILEREREIAGAKLQSGEYSQEDFDRHMRGIEDELYVHKLITNSDDPLFRESYNANFGVGVGIQAGLSALGICSLVNMGIVARAKSKEIKEEEKC